MGDMPTPERERWSEDRVACELEAGLRKPWRRDRPIQHWVAWWCAHDAEEAVAAAAAVSLKGAERRSAAHTSQTGVVERAAPRGGLFGVEAERVAVFLGERDFDDLEISEDSNAADAKRDAAEAVTAPAKPPRSEAGARTAPRPDRPTPAHRQLAR
jgi:hypothetical protein